MDDYLERKAQSIQNSLSVAGRNQVISKTSFRREGTGTTQVAQQHPAPANGFGVEGFQVSQEFGLDYDQFLPPLPHRESQDTSTKIESQIRGSTMSRQRPMKNYENAQGSLQLGSKMASTKQASDHPVTSGFYEIDEDAYAQVRDNASAHGM